MAEAKDSNIARRVRWTLAACGMCAVAADGWAMTPQEILESVKEGVAYIETFDKEGEPIGSGSGFLLGSKETLVTNQHVIEGACGIAASIGASRSATIRVLHADALRDIAVLSVKGLQGKPLAAGDLDALKPGDAVVAIGYPLTSLVGVHATVTDGLYSARTDTFPQFLQHSAPLSSGNSGGPLLDGLGRVLGINTLGVKGELPGGEVAQNVNLTVPISEVEALVFEKDGSVPSDTCAHISTPSAIVPIDAGERVVDPYEYDEVIRRMWVEARSRSGWIKSQVGTVLSTKWENPGSLTNKYYLYTIEAPSDPTIRVSQTDPRESIVSRFYGYVNVSVPIVRRIVKVTLDPSRRFHCDRKYYGECKAVGAIRKEKVLSAETETQDWEFTYSYQHESWVSKGADVPLD